MAPEIYLLKKQFLMFPLLTAAFFVKPLNAIATQVHLFTMAWTVF